MLILERMSKQIGDELLLQILVELISVGLDRLKIIKTGFLRFARGSWVLTLRM